MDIEPRRASRKALRIADQVRIYFRDGWLCHWCHRPVIFGLAFKYAECYVRDQQYPYPIAYFDDHWRRDRAPLLDHVGAVIDHVEPHSLTKNDDEKNLVTSCNKCNMRKSARTTQVFQNQYREKRVKGLYGEPAHWDGLVSLFLIFGNMYRSQLSRQEKKWLVEIEKYLKANRIAGE